MKILHIAKKYLDIMAGDSIVVASLEKFQKETGNRVFILTSNCDEIKKSAEITKFGLKIDTLLLDRINPNRIISLLLLFFYSFIYLRKIKPDIIHSHSPDLGFVLSFACRAYKIPIVNTCHGITFSDKHYSFLKRKTEEFFLKYGGFNKIITVNKNSLNDFGKLNINNIVYLPNGVDLDQFKNKKHTANNKTVFLFVGRIEIDKGLEYLIHAVNELKNINGNFEVLLIGVGIDQDYFKSLVVRLNLTRYIKFLGKKGRNETIDYYFKSDVFILPSVHEGFPLTLLEAWAAGLPVIMTRVGVASEICRNNKNSLIIPKENVKAITKSMITLIKNKNLRNKMGVNGKKLIMKNYTWKIINKRIEKIYEEAMV